MPSSARHSSRWTASLAATASPKRCRGLVVVLRGGSRRTAPKRRGPIEGGAVESIPKELQNIVPPQEELDRAVAMAKPTNHKVRKAADTRLRFEDEPASYLA